MRKVIVSIEMGEAHDCYQIRRSHQEGWFWINKDHPAIQDVTIATVPWTDGDIISDPELGRFVIVRNEGLWRIPGRNGSWGDDGRADRYVDSGWTVVRKQAEV